MSTPPVLSDPTSPAGTDGLPIAEVGSWAREKLVLIEKYIEISREARRRFIGKSEATYIDLYCGPGLSRIRDSNELLPGSPVAAYEAGRKSKVPLTRLLIGDADAQRLAASRTRLQARGATVTAFENPAEQAVDDVLASLNPYGLHFAFLDPYGLDLPFEVIRKLASLKRIDLMMLVSTGDLQRNFRREYVAPTHSRLDTFAPGWRDSVKTSTADDEALRQAIIDYWFSLLSALKFEMAPKMHAARNSKNVIMYWLVFASRSKIATKFWNEATKYLSNPQLF